jgi:hypothetical protein
MRTIQDLLDQKKTGKLDDMKYASMEELDAAIQQVMKEAQGLPEHFTRVEPDFSFKTLSDGATEAHIRVAPDDATISDLRILNCAESASQSRVEYYRDLNDRPDSIIASGRLINAQTDSPYYAPPSMDEKDAKTLAEDTVAALGLSDFVCSGQRIDTLYDPTLDAEDAPRRGVYEYMFTRQIGGVALTYTNDDGNEGDDKNKFEQFAPPWMYEKIRIIIDDKGILCLMWNSPCVVTGTVTDATTLKPFSEIQSI